MDFQTLARSLDQVLPNERLFSDVRRYLADFQQGDKYVLVFDYAPPMGQQPSEVAIPVDTEFHAVYKLFAFDIVGEPFNVFRGRVAIGDVHCCENNVIQSEYGFADVLYSLDMQVLTVDLLHSVLASGGYAIKEHIDP